MRRAISILSLTLIYASVVLRPCAAQSGPLDNDSIIQMVKWNLTDSEIIADIRRNSTNFDLSPTTIDVLTSNGVSEVVLNAMFTASKHSSKSLGADNSGGIRPPAKKPRTPPATTPPAAAPPATTPPAAAPPATTPPAAAPPATAPPATAPPATAPPAAAPPATAPPATAPPATTPSATIIPTHTPERFAEAIGVTAATPPMCDANTSSSCVSVFQMLCPLANDGSAPSKSISLYFASATSDPTRVDDSGVYCFEVRDFNDILYTASFQVTETVPTGSALDYLQDAIKTVTGMSFGGATTNTTAADAKTAAAAQKGIAPANAPLQCPTELVTAITNAQGAAARFGAALSGIDPGKDSNGNINLVDWRTTTIKWQPVPEAYKQFEAAVSRVIAGLQLKDVDVCTDDVKAKAEAIVIDTYLPARATYTSLASHVASDHVMRTTSQLHSTNSYTVAVQANYPSGNVVGGTKTFSLAAGRKILSSSGGFLVTELPSTSYSSVTAPSGMTNPSTQNVLAVTNPSGPSLGLAALLSVYVPDFKRVRLNGRDWGLALSAGPTYNLSNGKADSSKFGLFAGVSLHIRSQLFLTPGINIGEYSGFPVGFSHPGQVIPPNVGTPTGVNRWSARFGFTITFKIKDFGQSTTPTPVAPAATPTTNTPQTKPPKTT
jgi:hypothetical protein